MSSIELIVKARSKDLGGFEVRRVLPYMTHRMVGPFIFFDHMGPANFEPGQGMNVRPHPHINLQTVTFLFSGRIQHKDSLGSDLPIEPGAVNLMTAGRGIVHSERTPAADFKVARDLHGIQCWLAVPEAVEEIEPAFVHHPKTDLPEFRVGNVEMKLLLGSAYDRQSPARVYSNLFYLSAAAPSGARFQTPSAGRECAIYVVEGEVRIANERIEPCSMAVLKTGVDVEVEVTKNSRLMILGGESVGERFIDWNFVSSSEARIHEARDDWEPGPRKESQRFPPIPGDDQEFIPLPPAPGTQKGTIL